MGHQTHWLKSPGEETVFLRPVCNHGQRLRFTALSNSCILQWKNRLSFKSIYLENYYERINFSANVLCCAIVTIIVIIIDTTGGSYAALPPASQKLRNTTETGDVLHSFGMLCSKQNAFEIHAVRLFEIMRVCLCQRNGPQTAYFIRRSDGRT